MNIRLLCCLLPLVLAACSAPSTPQAKAPVVRLVLRDHVFSPATVRVPANAKIDLVIVNEDATAEEFDSQALYREKVVDGKSTGRVSIGPLAPGRYPFSGEFHEDQARGVVIAQ